MIKLTLPRDSEVYWTDIANAFFGPMDYQGNSIGVTMTYRDSTDYIDEAKGPYGENFVVHRQTIADVSYNPIWPKIVPAPTTMYPDRVSVTFVKEGSTSAQPVYMNHGVAAHRRVTMEIGASAVTQTAWTVTSPSQFTLTRVTVDKKDVNKITYFQTVDYEFDSIYLGKYFSYKSRSRTNNSGFGDNSMAGKADWSRKQTYDTIRSLLDDVTLTVGSWAGGGYGTRYSFLGAPSASVLAAKARIANVVTLDHYPLIHRIKKEHFGNLAMKASKKFNSNTGNMIEFLKDLRHAKQLIPKLKNLRSLKGLSGEYLAFKFGVLPTISDIKTIVNAVKARGPYFDKNGFETYSAGHTEEYREGDVTVTSKQQLKLAILNEDRGLVEIVHRLDNMGLFPTFENVWDLIPYSFVVDWLVDVGGFLERVDTRLRLQNHDIRYVTMSHKTVTKSELTPSFASPYVGTVELVRYHRWVSDQCPVPPLSVETTFQDFNHWLEASALIIQRKKTRR